MSNLTAEVFLLLVKYINPQTIVVRMDVVNAKQGCDNWLHRVEAGWPIVVRAGGVAAIGYCHVGRTDWQSW